MSAPDPLAGLGADSSLFAQKLEPLRGLALIIRMSRDAYLAASFLDDRILAPGTEGVWIAHDEVARRLEGAAAKPLHFIFHAGHTGSTLASRLLDETGCVQPLREPLTLRQLADFHDALGRPDSLLSAAQFASLLETQIALWRRGWPECDAVILKATSSAARLGPALLAAAPEARAIHLGLAPEPYLATLLAGANSWIDLRGMGRERMRRLTGHLGEAPGALHALSLGQLAAMTWLTERLTLARLEAAAGARLKRVDFDALLDDAPGEMAGVAAHFGLSPPAGWAAGLPQSRALTTYSKAPEHAYSPALRAQILAAARAAQSGEIRAGLAWLEALGARHQAVAGVLG
ncbi:MAG: hypothetical protein GC206_12385 [Alphaproteobacteria bacterium]|nr:hypothetical protein [Alphaproteobacteria bacterium]